MFYNASFGSEVCMVTCSLGDSNTPAMLRQSFNLFKGVARQGPNKDQTSSGACDRSIVMVD
jgi:hypothetical protein